MSTEKWTQHGRNEWFSEDGETRVILCLHAGDYPGGTGNLYFVVINREGCEVVENVACNKPVWSLLGWMMRPDAEA